MIKDILTMISEAGWYTRTVEINGNNPESQWDSTSHTFQMPDGTVAPRSWWVDLHHNSGMKKFGHGSTLAEALLDAWNKEEVERQTLYLRHPDLPTVSAQEILNIVIPQRPVYRRF